MTGRILLLSDLHTMSLWGMMPPNFQAEDPRTGQWNRYVPNGTQTKLWKHWEKMLTVLKKNKPDCIIFNGDLIDGLQKKGYGRGVVSTDIGLQVKACIEIIKTLPKVPMFFTQGTPYHENADGTPVEQYIAERFKGEDGDQLIVETCGIRLFCRHAIGMSSSTWQFFTTAPARDQMLLYLNKNPEIYGDIDVAVFSHRHQFVAAQFNSGLSLVTPCWQTMTPYAVMKGLVSPPDIGWVMLNIENRKCITIDRNGITHIERPAKVVGCKGIRK